MTHLLILALPLLLFVGLLVCIHVGRRYRHLPRDADSSAAVAPIVTTVLSLMGLVLGFSFANGATRLDSSRKAILDEANAIETAWTLIDVAEPELRPPMTDLFRRYVDARIRAYESYEERMGVAEYDREVERSAQVFRQLWAAGIASTPAHSVERSILLGALGRLRDTATTRSLAMNTHLPPAIHIFLFGIVLVGAVLVGSGLARTGRLVWFYQVVFAAVLSWTIFAILDMEYPRLGGFQLLRSADALLVELRRSM
jgi:hypothetical protein